MNGRLGLLPILAVTSLTCVAAHAGDKAKFRVRGAWPGAGTPRAIGFSPGVKHIWQGSPLGVVGYRIRAGKICDPIDFARFEGVTFHLTRMTSSGPEAVSADFVGVPERHTYGYMKGMARNGPYWYAWCDLKPGDYVFRVEPPAKLGLEVARKEVPFRAHAQRSEEDRCDVLRFAILSRLELEQFAEAEKSAIEYARALGPDDSRSFLLLSDACEGLGQHRKALEFRKVFLRDPANRLAINHALPMAEIVYARLAVAAGEARSREEGEALFREFWRKVRAGEDTGNLPEAYLTAIYGDTAAAQGGGHKPLVIGASAAGVVLLAIGAFLLLRRARRSGG